MTWLALDIGGANLKAADGRGWARGMPFPLWRDPAGLPAAVATLIASAPIADRIAVTMTGELCDAYRRKEDGVRHIIASVIEGAGKRSVWVYLVDGRLVAARDAELVPLLAAASNWHVLARFACRFVSNDPGMLIDIGSTTTDIIPLANGRPQARGLTDTDRLLAGELVYTGVGRTPICAVTDRLPWGDALCPIAAELFATTADSYVTLGDLPEQPNCTATADGRPLTKELCHERLARMICADRQSFGPADAIQAAAAIRDAQVALLHEALEQIITALRRVPATFVLSGTGEFLARQLISELAPPARIVSLAKEIGDDASECGPAHALAVTAADGTG
jgi:probable H4MPT-linked C1 transfer pathway protein